MNGGKETGRKREREGERKEVRNHPLNPVLIHLVLCIRTVPDARLISL